MRLCSGYAALLLLVVCGLGCGLSRAGSNSAVAVNSPSPQRTALPSPTLTPVPSATPSALIDTLRHSSGKYPYELKLMENKELQSRIRKLMGDAYPKMKADFDVQTPVEISGVVFFTSGCEAHNCGNIYYLAVDLSKDNINVIHVENERVTNYFEHGRIKLPEKFASQIPEINDESSPE